MKPQPTSRITIAGSGKQSRRRKPEDDKVTGRQGDKALTLSPPHPVTLSPLRAWRIGLIDAAWRRVVARALAGEGAP